MAPAGGRDFAADDDVEDDDDDRDDKDPGRRLDALERVATALNAKEKLTNSLFV